MVSGLRRVYDGFTTGLQRVDYCQLGLTLEIDGFQCKNVRNCSKLVTTKNYIDTLVVSKFKHAQPYQTPSVYGYCKSRAVDRLSFNPRVSHGKRFSAIHRLEKQNASFSGGSKTSTLSCWADVLAGKTK
jgi:hypothetical protein